jgi:hypothetical protein
MASPSGSIHCVVYVHDVCNQINNTMASAKVTNVRRKRDLHYQHAEYTSDTTVLHVPYVYTFIYITASCIQSDTSCQDALRVIQLVAK